MAYSTAILFSIIGAVLCSSAYGNVVLPVSGVLSLADLANAPGFNETALQQVENVRGKIKEKCEKNGGSYDNLISGKDQLETCLRGLMDFDVLKDEIEKAKPHGELDIVFQKYCLKNLTLIKCMDDFINVLNPCLEIDERQSLQTLPNITKSLLKFVCHKEGDRIALFIAAEGPECFKEKQTAILDCFNSTYSSVLPSFTANTTPNLTLLPSMVFNLQQCRNAETLQNCVVRELEKCDDPTPGNMADALLNFVKNSTPCREILKPIKN